jgi:hypothetical protein
VDSGRGNTSYRRTLLGKPLYRFESCPDYLKTKVMKNKVWYKIEIATEEQNVSIYPSETYDGIIVETKELDDKTGSPRLYLNVNEMELLIERMIEMMKYVKS